MERILLLGLLLALPGCSAPDPFQETLIRLRDPDQGVRETAVFELGEQSDPRAAQALMWALSDRSAEVRLAAAMAIKSSDFEGSELVQALSRSLHDPEPQVREWSVLALGRIAEPAALPALHRAKADPEADVRSDAVSAIERIDFAIQANEVRYHPPTVIPIAFSQGDREVYLKAHEDEWMYAVSQVTDVGMMAPELSGSFHTICECPPAETEGGYLGQHDASGFLQALHQRIKRDPRVLADFKVLRDQALKRFPPPKPIEDEH